MKEPGFRILYLIIGFSHVYQLLCNYCEDIFVTVELYTVFNTADQSLKYFFHFSCGVLFGFLQPRATHARLPLLLLHLPDFFMLGYPKAPSLDLLCCLSVPLVISSCLMDLNTIYILTTAKWTSVPPGPVFWTPTHTYWRFPLGLSNATCLKLNSKSLLLQTYSHLSLPQIRSW